MPSVSPPSAATDDDELFAFGPDDDDDTAPAPVALPSWKVLVVDDDLGVHQVTALSLGDLEIEHHPVQLLRAHSAAEGQARLREHGDIALVLLDVVMETDDAGLRLARWIRDELASPLVRILLRTGQPGQAPESEVMARYDIHDYLSKTDVTAQRLRTAVTGAVRAFRDLKTIALQRQGLEKVIRATAALFTPATLPQLLNGILEQVAALLLPREHALFFLAREPLFHPSEPDPRILAGCGRFVSMVGRSVREALPDIELSHERVAREGEWFFLRADGLFELDLGDGVRAALYLESALALSDWERQTVALFCASAAMALRNQRLYLEREELLRAFERFVPKRFIELLGARDVREVTVGAQSACEMTVLFIDVIGFTRRSEALGPARVFALLNQLYGAIGPVVESVGGLIDKYQGDGVLVLFPGDRAGAAGAAVAIQQAVRALAVDPGAAPLEVGVSLDHGTVVLGTVGHPQRFDTTVVSDVVNVAARVQLLCRWLRTTVLASEAVVRGLDAPLHRALGPFSLRGREADVELHEIFEGDPAAVRAAKVETREAFAEGIALRRAGRHLEAAGAFQRCIQRCPDDHAAIWMASDCLEAHRRR